MLIVNMAAADVLVAITAIPLSIAYLFQSVKWFPGGFGVFLCKFLPFIAYLSIGASVLTLILMTFDRYLAIVRTMRRPLSSRLTMVAIASTWVISGAIFATELYKHKLFNYFGHVICAPRWVEDLQKSHNITMYEMIIRFVLLYLIPLFTITVLNAKIALHLWKRRAPGEQIVKNCQRIRGQNRKVIFMLVTIVTIFAICWLPAHVNHFLVTFDFKTYSCLPTSLILTFYFMTHANTAINPCMYFIFNESFREALKQQIRNRSFSGAPKAIGRGWSASTAPRTVSSSITNEFHPLSLLSTETKRKSEFSVQRSFVQNNGSNCSPR